MIRKSTPSDCELIAKALWSIWHRIKVQQIATPLHRYPSSTSLGDEISRDLNRWLVCEPFDSHQPGFFAVSPMGNDKAFKKWGFPECAVEIDHFACLSDGNVLLEQFKLLTAHLCGSSILLRIPTALRDAYWAGQKANFKLLGENPLIVGAYAWLYLDREQRFDEIQLKLRRARVLA